LRIACLRPGGRRWRHKLDAGEAAGFSLERKSRQLDRLSRFGELDRQDGTSAVLIDRYGDQHRLAGCRK
jgi:hypothetical protein